MKLCDRVHLVGSGQMGFELTDPYDCHVYVLDGGEELALIDAGCGRSSGQLLAHARADGLDTSRVRHVILTHGHADHSAGVPSVARLLGTPRVYAPEPVAGALRAGDEAAISLDVARRAGRYPRDYPFEPFEVTTELRDGTVVEVGDLQVQAIATPGHSGADVCLTVQIADKRVLFSGDTVFFGGTVLLQDMHDCRVQELTRSLRRLRAAAIDALLPGHMEISLGNGQRHIERANLLLDRLRIPDQLPAVAWQ